MKRLQIAVLMMSCFAVYPTVAADVYWVNKNLAQSTDSSKPNHVTMIFNHEYGDTNRNAYYCRENDRSDGLTNVGKAIVFKGQPLSTAACFIPWDGKEYKRTENFDLLKINGPFKWSSGNVATSIHLDSYSFGPSHIRPIYGCHDGRTGTLGKLLYTQTAQGTYGICYVPMGGVEHKVIKSGFAVLSYPSAP